MNRLLTVLLVVLAVALGAAAVVAGEADDSPGLQGLGVLVVLAALWSAGRGRHRARRRTLRP